MAFRTMAPLTAKGVIKRMPTTSGLRTCLPSGRPPIAENQVRILRTAAQVTGKYEEVALLNSTGESNWTNEQKMMESMRRKAASLGREGPVDGRFLYTMAGYV